MIINRPTELAKGKSRGGKSMPGSIPVKLPLVGPCTFEFKADGTSSMPVDSCFHLVGYVTSTDTNYTSGIIDNMNSNSTQNSKTTNSKLHSKLQRNKSTTN
jgi:hypothetical protein